VEGGRRWCHAERRQRGFGRGRIACRVGLRCALSRRVVGSGRACCVARSSTGRSCWLPASQAESGNGLERFPCSHARGPDLAGGVEHAALKRLFDGGCRHGEDAGACRHEPLVLARRRSFAPVASRGKGSGKGIARDHVGLRNSEHSRQAPRSAVSRVDTDVPSSDAPVRAGRAIGRFGTAVSAGCSLDHPRT
jgi:hypothetical protein